MCAHVQILSHHVFFLYPSTPPKTKQKNKAKQKNQDPFLLHCFAFSCCFSHLVSAPTGSRSADLPWESFLGTCGLGHSSDTSSRKYRKSPETVCSWALASLLLQTHEVKRSVQVTGKVTETEPQLPTVWGSPVTSKMTQDILSGSSLCPWDCKWRNFDAQQEASREAPSASAIVCRLPVRLLWSPGGTDGGPFCEAMRQLLLSGKRGDLGHIRADN